MPNPPQLTSVVRELSPDLTAAGWKKVGVTFNRQAELGLVHVINFQASKWGGQFTVNLGVYVREIDRYLDDWWGRRGKSAEPGRDGVVPENVCWLRARLGRLASPGNDLWWSYDSDAGDVARDIKRRLTEHATPAFERAASRDAILAAYGPDQNFPPWLIVRGGLGYAILLSTRDRRGEATKVLDDLIAKANGAPFATVATLLAERLGLFEGN